MATSKNKKKNLKDLALIEAIKSRDDALKRLDSVLEYACWMKEGFRCDRELGFNSVDVKVGGNGV